MAKPHESDYEDLNLPDTDYDSEEDQGQAVRDGGLDSVSQSTTSVDAEVGGDPDNEVRKKRRSLLTESYLELYKPPPKDYLSANYDVFKPDVPITVRVVAADRDPSFMNPYLYTIEVEHNGYNWTIKRRYKHFTSLHQHLQLYRAKMIIPIPLRKHRQRRKTINEMSRKNRRLPSFPKRLDTLVTEDKLKQRQQSLEKYLQRMLESPLYRNHQETRKFLEVSRLSFVSCLGQKHREGNIRKRGGGRHSAGRCSRFICQPCVRNICSHYQERWLVLKDTFIAYITPKNGAVSGVILMDQELNIETGLTATGSNKGLLLNSSCRQLFLKGWSKRYAKEWEEAIHIAMKTTAVDFTTLQPHGSFAPIRHDCRAEWFGDARTCFTAIADAITGAREEIFITDWMLSPEIYMKRPMVDGDTWRLDKLLHRKANEGVKVYVMLYKEVEMALGIGSLYSKQKLVEKHSDNIKVLRHPDHLPGGVFLWAHHEKLVVIDQEVAFVGGIDLCYGRWDDHHHRLTDLGGMDVVKKQFLPTKTLKTSGTSSNTQAPFTLLHLAHVAHDVTMNPIRQLDSKLKAMHVNPKLARKNSLDNIYIPDPNDADSVAIAEAIESPDVEEETDINLSSKLWVGKDYVNFIVRDVADVSEPFTDLVDRTTTPRLPWHDIGSVVMGTAARDVARHFIQRWNYIKAEKAKDHPSYPLLLPKAYNPASFVYCNAEGDYSSTRKDSFGQIEGDAKATELPASEQIEKWIPLLKNLKLKRVDCQVLRSVSNWSCGLKSTEASIEKAYVSLIENSQHYVYIENQFFVTTVSPTTGCVANRIGEAIYKRIVRAHRAKQVYRVFVIIPLLPAFEGQIGAASGCAIQAVTHYNYASICRGPDSLYSRLMPEVGDPAKYLSFYGLRTHGILHETPVTELIYVHSKLMIVDDMSVIVGSANINDRSMLGKRDSEVACLYTDLDTQPGKMNGESVRVGKFATSLRKRLMKEHLGLLSSEKNKNLSNTDASMDEPILDVTDPVIESFYKGAWMKTASLNTDTYEKIFRCIPSDSVRSFAQLKSYHADVPLSVRNPSLAKELLADKVRGNLVLFPLQFLSEEELRPPTGTMESLMPTNLWT